MAELNTLNLFLILGLFLPGVVILGAGVFLFPESTLLKDQDFWVYLGSVLFTSAMIVNPGLFFESHVLERILWPRIHKDWKSYTTRELLVKRSGIIAKAEIYGIPHNLFDQLLGEHLLFTNTSFGLLLLSIARQVINRPDPSIRILAGLVFIASLVTLLFVVPHFKMAYLHILSLLEKDSLPDTFKEPEQNVTGEKNMG